MRILKDGKLIAVIDDETMEAASVNREFNRVYGEFRKNGIRQLGPGEPTKDNSETDAMITYPVVKRNLGIIVGALEEMGYEVTGAE